MRCFYDLHIHSCLSPCASEDMTPHSIAGMSYINGLDIIAVADHNSARNVRAVSRAAEGYGVLCVPAIEAESAENIHLLCLFESVEAAEDMGKMLKEHLPPIKNRPDIFGTQLIMNEHDEIQGEEDMLLINATDIAIEQMKREVEKRGGVCLPAHIDREKNGIVSVLGCVPKELCFGSAEVSRFTKKGFAAPYGIKKITNSDAHMLTDISEKVNYMDIEEKTISAVIKKLR